MDTPILFLIFNRPNTTQFVFEAIKKQQPSKLYIAADGPRLTKPDDTELCRETRKVVSKIDWPCEVKTLYRNENLGCKRAVSSAIDWFFEHEEQGIILEDDCLPNSSFFTFCSKLLDRYKDDESIMHIGGCNVIDDIKSNNTYSFIRYPLIWGWATWRRSWKLYDVNMASYPIKIKEGFLQNAFPRINIRSHWKFMFDRAFNNKFNTWDYQWTYAILSHNKLSIIPNKNTVVNIGFSDGATHTSEADDRTSLKSYMIDEIVHPEAVSVNSDLENKIESKYYSFSLSKRLLLKWLKK